jgi:GAF domain-containing protein
MRPSSAVIAARSQQLDPADQARVASVERSGMLSRAGAELDEITTQVLSVMDTQLAALTVILGTEQLILSFAGAAPGVELEAVSPRETGFCTHVVASRRPLMLTDTIRDPFFAQHPLVEIEGGIRSYCGVPIIMNDGQVSGALCAVDSRERQFSLDQLRQLTALAQRARQVLLVDVQAIETPDVEQWVCSDPLAAWIASHAPTDQAVDELRAARERRLSRWRGVRGVRSVRSAA